MGKFEVEYRGFTITYHEEDEVWYCHLNNKRFDKETLKQAKKRIDDFLKEAFNRFDVYTSDGYARDSYAKIVTVTSIAEDGQLWTIDAKGSRSKIHKKYCYVLNDKNTELIAEHNRQSEIRNEAGKIQTQLESQLERVQ